MEKFSVNMERIATLLEQWEQGATISTQEQELRDFFIYSKEIPQEWESYKIIFCGFAALSQEKASRNYSSLGRNFGFFKTVTLYFAAAVLIAALCLSILLLRRPYCYINGKPIRNAEIAMQATDALSDLSRFDVPVEALKQLENLSVPDNLK